MTKERKDLLIFGYGMAAILSLIAWRLWMKHGFSPVKGVLLAVAAVLFVTSVINVDWLKPVYKRYMAAGRFLGEIVSGVILAVVFVCVFSVIGIILRLLGKDLLEQKIDPQARSYWIPRPEAAEDPERYTRQS